jgi:hypothetical protein
MKPPATASAQQKLRTISFTLTFCHSFNGEQALQGGRQQPEKERRQSAAVNLVRWFVTTSRQELC